MAALEASIVFSIVAALTYLAAMTATLLVLALRAGERRENPADDHSALSASRFTIPVSLIVPMNAGEDGPATAETITALLGLNYPELEVIVVADALPAAFWEPLKDAWSLEAREIFYRRTLATADVRMMYRSARDSRLMVLSKSPGSMADAMNCGVNLARYRYVSTVEPGVVFDADALLRAMTAPLRDPASVVGATSHVEIRDGVFQRLRSIRSLMESHLVWRNLHAALGPRDAVVVWRRDAVEQSGGFSTAAADPNLEMMVRVQTSTAPGVRGQVVRTAEIFGHRNPRAIVEHVRSTARRQLAALQAVSSLVAAGPNTRLMLGYFFVSEVLTPCVQAWAMLATVIGAAAGWLPWADVGLAVLLLAVGHGIVTSAALLLRGGASLEPDARSVTRLLLFAPLDLFVFGIAAGYARVAGVWAFVKS